MTSNRINRIILIKIGLRNTENSKNTDFGK